MFLLRSIFVVHAAERSWWLVSETTLYLGKIIHCTGDPWEIGSAALQVIENGYLAVERGRIKEVGDAEEINSDMTLRTCKQVDYRGNYILPGFVDGHLHYPQTGVIASHGTQLLEWLQKYTFPAEAKFIDEEYAADAAKFFIHELLKNGTTSAMVFATVHETSVDAVFACAASVNMRLASGKVMMDRNCPDNLQDTATDSYEISQQLIERWHGKHRLSYAVTPRFAPTSSDEQLAFAGKLFHDNEGVYCQSHVAENKAEVAWVAELFPWSRSYLDVYDHFGLLGERAIYAHCIYLDDTDLTRMAGSESVAAFCPTSNLFLGSGLFNLALAREKGIKTTLATDVGGGTSFSMLRTADEAYKVTRMAGGAVTPLELFYEMTLGGSRSLSIDDVTGNFAVGKEADFVVIDPAATELLAQRIDLAESTEEALFALIVLGDDRCTRATYLYGEPVYTRHDE